MKSPIGAAVAVSSAVVDRHSGRQPGRIVAIGGEQAGEHALRPRPRTAQHRRRVRTCGHRGSASARAPPAPPCPPRSRPAAGRPARTSSAARDAGLGGLAAPVSSSTSLTIRPIWSRTSSGTSRACLDVGIAGRGPRAHRRGDQRHLEQLLEREQAGAQAVVDVVIVVGDVVGDRRHLRLEARPAAPDRAGIRSRPRPAPRADRPTGPLCLASPSSVSQLRLSPSWRG